MSATAGSGAAARKDAAYPAWLEPATWLGALLLRALGRSWRFVPGGPREFGSEHVNPPRCIYALWHARMLPMIFAHRRRQVAVLVSRHRDGQLITRIIERIGFVTARGSSTRGGEEGLREMIEWAGRGHSLAITPDGPRGPAERVKPGLVYLASRTGLPIVPVASASASFWKLRSWDRFRVPRPFARVWASYGPPIVIPPGLDREALAAYEAQVEAALATLTADVDARAGNPA